MLQKKFGVKVLAQNVQKANVQKYTRPKLRKAEKEEREANATRTFPNNFLRGEKFNLYPFLDKNEIPNDKRPLRHQNDPIRARRDAERARAARQVFNQMKKPISEEETTRRIERNVTRERGGTVGYDGGMNEGYEEILKRIENIAPQSYHAFPRAMNKDQSEWLYNIPIGILHKKPTDDFEKEIMRNKQNWSEGRLISPEKQKEMWKNTLATLPIFEKKPADPFRSRPQGIHRISYKDPKTLVKFLSRGGRILNPRFTGVRWKTQRKIKREIHKARFLGLFPYLGNPVYNQQQYQPDMNREGDDKEEWLDSLIQSKNKFRDYIENLEDGIQVTGDSKWIAPKNVRNPRFSSGIITQELKGHLKEQVNFKADEISHMTTLDDTLVPLRKITHNGQQRFF